MEIIKKIIIILFVFGVIYLWNRFVITFMVKRMVKLHKKYNSRNLDRQPIKFLVTREAILIKMIGWIYWAGGVVVALGLFFGDPL